MSLVKNVLRSALGTGFYNNLKRVFKYSVKQLKYHPQAPEFQDGSKLFFVTGRSKSGTTWMAKLLNSHPDLFCHAQEQAAFHQDREISYASDWHQILTPENEELLNTRLLRLLKNGLITNLICDCDQLSVKKFGDKSVRQDAELILDLFPRTQVVAMVRDFRDCVVSLAFHRARLGTWEGNFASSERKALDNQFLREQLENYEHHKDFQTYVRLASERPEQLMIVRYEDMKTKPVDTLKGVFAFLGVNSAASIVDTCLQMNTFAKLSGGRKPGQENAGHFYRKGVIGDWRNHFDEANVAVFKEIAGETLIAAGYEQDNDWDV